MAPTDEPEAADHTRTQGRGAGRQAPCQALLRGAEGSPVTKPLTGAPPPGMAGVCCGLRDPSMGLGGVSSAASCGLGPWEQPGNTAGREVAAESPQTSNLRPQSTSSRSSRVTGAAAWRLSPIPPGLAGVCPLQAGRGGKVTMSSGGGWGRQAVSWGPDVCDSLKLGLRGAAMLQQRTPLAQEGRQVPPHIQQRCPASGSAWTPSSVHAPVTATPGLRGGGQGRSPPQRQGWSWCGARVCGP